MYEALATTPGTGSRGGSGHWAIATVPHVRNHNYKIMPTLVTIPSSVPISGPPCKTWEVPLLQKEANTVRWHALDMWQIEKLLMAKIQCPRKDVASHMYNCRSLPTRLRTRTLCQCQSSFEAPRPALRVK